MNRTAAQQTLATILLGLGIWFVLGTVFFGFVVRSDFTARPFVVVGAVLTAISVWLIRRRGHSSGAA